MVAASAGNHAQGVALASSLLGVRSTVFMPNGAPLPKISATRDYGAEVRLHGQVVDETLAAAQEYAAETGAVFIHPFDHPDVIAGQGTVGLEILEQCPEVRTIVVGIGGGGLAAGIAVAVKALRPDVRIIGVQAAGSAAYPPSLAAGRPVSIGNPATMADGIRVGRPGDVPFAIVGNLVDEVRTVSEDELSAALLLCLERAKLVVEPAGASPVAALLSGPDAFEGPVVAVLSGGNVDPVLMQRVLRHGMAAQGRYLAVRLRLTDRPGALATLLGGVVGGRRQRPGREPCADRPPARTRGGGGRAAPGDEGPGALRRGRRGPAHRGLHRHRLSRRAADDPRRPVPGRSRVKIADSSSPVRERPLRDAIHRDMVARVAAPSGGPHCSDHPALPQFVNCPRRRGDSYARRHLCRRPGQDLR
ncbi:hypothetical protein GCM10020295_29870 [Streptomyces cinereospinus]